jgi:membrane protein DedA with SNARE-associated domain
MSVLGVIIAGTFGSWLGSAITYWVALVVGRPVVMKFGKYFRLFRQNCGWKPVLDRREAAGVS